MARHPLKNWSKSRLRLALGAVFIMLALPTGVLLVYAYSQLKWEAFHQQRVLAEELVKQIDRQLNAIIATEDARPFTDYAFLNVSGTPLSNRIHRSPLSKFPNPGPVKGTLGYFQIDPDGRFSSPVFPADTAATAQQANLSEADFEARKSLREQLYQVLSGNNLVTAKSKQERQRQAQVGLGKSDAQIAPLAANEPLADQLQSEISSSMSDQAGAGAPSPAPPSSELYAPTDVFEKLSKDSGSADRDKAPMKQSLGRLDELNLSKQYQQKSAEVAKKKSKEPETRQSLLRLKKERSIRKEQSQLPMQQYEGNSGAKTQTKATIGINMFESEIDAMDFSVLDSGHFILFRKVWKDGQRLIQGILFEPNAFIDNIIRSAFYDSALSASTDLTVAYGDNILTLLTHRDQRDYWSKPSQVEGFLLLEHRLAEPFTGINLLFSAKQLPPGPGATVLNWLALILLLVLCAGFWFLYRVGVRQLNLAQQQQDFISAVSHELKTPLTSIRMYGEMLLQGWMNDEKRQQYYAFIFDESERLTRLINNILQMARMTRNELHLELKPLSARQLKDTLQSKVSSQIERAGFSFELDVEDSAKDLVAEVDLDYFVQIIINLVDNAIKFSTKAENKRVEIYCRRVDKNRMQWCIRDFGPGIAKGQMRKIFQLFYRSENELTRETLGTGIGLALVSELTQAMNGKIDVVNQQPGAEFCVSFPASVAAANAAALENA